MEGSHFKVLSPSGIREYYSRAEAQVASFEWGGRIVNENDEHIADEPSEKPGWYCDCCGIENTARLDQPCWACFSSKVSVGYWHY